MKDIVLINDNKLFLNTSLSEEMFGKTKFSVLLDEKGLLVSKNSKDEYAVFSEWKLDTAQLIEDSVFFSREGFCGKKLSDLITEDSEEGKNAVYNTVSAISFAQKQNIKVPCNSPMGIICGQDYIIFLPERTFDRCAANLGREQYEKIQNEWRDAASDGIKAESFLQGTLAYFALTKKLPYPAAEDSDKTVQSVNIADHKFLPVELCVNGINKNLAFAINDALKNNLENSKYFPLEIFKEELFQNGPRKNAVPDEKFAEMKEKFLQHQNFTVSTKRKFRKFYIYGIVLLAAVLIVLLFTMLIRHEAGKKPSVMGLTSQQVTEVFYEGIHRMNPELMEIAAKDCPQAQYYIKTVPQIFVTAQMQGAYNFKSGISTPENWMFFEPDTTKSYSHQIYGLSNFTIDGKNSILNIIPPEINEDKERIKRQDGKRIKNLEEKKHHVQYYLIHTVNNGLQVDLYNTDVYLTYEDDKWQVMTLDQSWETNIYDWAVFSADLKKAREEAGGNAIKSVLMLKEKYPWVPTEESLTAEEKYLDSTGIN